VIHQSSNVVAVGAVTSPLWLEQLQQWSDLAATIVPILGAVWLAIQILGYLWKHFK
jgi:hypothetical protein